MLVRPYDRSSMLALFDQCSTAVFTAGSRLVDGDAAAVRLLVDAFRHVAAAVDRSEDGIRVDCATPVDAVHVASIRSGADPDDRTIVEFAVASLHEVEQRSVAEIATVLNLSGEDVAPQRGHRSRRTIPVLSVRESRARPPQPTN